MIYNATVTDRYTAAVGPVEVDVFATGGTATIPAWGLTWHHGRINSYRAWKVAEDTIGARGAVTLKGGVVDTGLPAFNPTYPKPVDSPDPAGYGGMVDTQWNEYGHGLATSSIIFGRHNGVGISGLAPGCPMYVNGVLDMAGASIGITWAVDAGCKVINLSYGAMRAEGDETDYTNMLLALQYAVAHGAIVVSSVGNDGVDIDDPEYEAWPAEMANALGVASLFASEEKPLNSNYGGQNIDIVAPTSVGTVGDPRFSPGRRYYSMHGTSAAAPVVSGVLLLAWSMNESLSRSQILDILGATGSPFWYSQTQSFFPGLRVVNAAKAVLAAKSTRADKANQIFPYIGFISPSWTQDDATEWKAEDRGAPGFPGLGEAPPQTVWHTKDAAGNVTTRVRGNVIVEATGYVNGSSAAITRVVVTAGGSTVYDGAPGSFTADTSAWPLGKVGITAYTATGSVTEVYDDLLIDTAYNHVIKDTFAAATGTLTVNQFTATPGVTVPVSIPAWQMTWANGRLNTYRAWKVATEVLGALGSPLVKGGVVDSGLPVFDTPDIYIPNVSPYHGMTIPRPADLPPAEGATGAVDTGNGHGLLVSSIIFGKHNATGIAGLAPDCPMIVQGNGNNYTSDALGPSIRAAVDAGAKVINASVGEMESSWWWTPAAIASVWDACNYAYAHGAIVVCAMGNDGVDLTPSDPESNFWPGECALATGVAALYATEERAPYSNYGSPVDIVAPTNLNAIGDPRMSTNQDFLSGTGTSSAAPAVSGSLLLAWSMNPALTHVQVRDLLSATASPFVRASAATWFPAGTGVVNTAKLVTAAKSTRTDQAGKILPYLGFISPGWVQDDATGWKTSRGEQLEPPIYYPVGVSALAQSVWHTKDAHGNVKTELRGALTVEATGYVNGSSAAVTRVVVTVGGAPVYDGPPGVFTASTTTWPAGAMVGITAYTATSSATEVYDDVLVGAVPETQGFLAPVTFGAALNATYGVNQGAATFGATLGASVSAIWDPPLGASLDYGAQLGASVDAFYAETAGVPSFGATFGDARSAEWNPPLPLQWIARVARSALSWVAGPFGPFILDYSTLLQFAFGAGFSADAWVDYHTYDGFPARLDFASDAAFGPALAGGTDFPWTAGAAFDAEWDVTGPRGADTDLYARPIPVGLEATNIPATLRARVHPVTVRCGMATAMVYQGDDVDVHFEARDSDGNTIDITGAVLTCEADVEGSADNAVGIAAARFWIDDGPRGVCRARFTSAQTAAMTARKTYLYDGRIRMPDNQVHTIGSGSFKVLAAKTPTPT